MNATEPTRPRDLAVITAVLGVLAWVVVFRAYGSLPKLQWYVPMSLALLAALETVLGAQTRARIRRKAGDELEPVNPLVAARLLALAKASSVVGAGVAGAWLGLLVYTAPRLGYLAAARGDTVTASLGVLASVLLVGAALWLEWCCRAPDDDGSGRPDDRRR